MTLGGDTATFTTLEADQAVTFHGPQSAGEIGLGLPVMRASSSSEPGAFSAMTRSSSRLPTDRIFGEGSGLG